jgi:tetratricopeptide (TPR) repeat protein
MDQEVVAGRERNRDLDSLRKGAAYAYLNAGRVYAKHGKAREAEQHWTNAARLDPNDTESRQMLVMVFEQQDRSEEAIPILEELSRIEPENPIHYVNIGALNVRLQRFEAAEDAYRRLKQRAPDSPRGYVALARLFLDTGRRLSEAKELAAKAVQLEPTASNYFLLGTACERSGDTAGALSAVERARQLDPGNSLYRDEYAKLQGKE